WLLLRGAARGKAGDAAGARADFRSAVELDAAYACSDDTLPERRSRMDVSYFDACIERLPGQARLHLDRGVARFEAGKRDEAAADLQRAVELQPDYPEAELSLAWVLSELGRKKDAAAELDRALARAPARSEQVYERLRELRRSLSGAAH